MISQRRGPLAVGDQVQLTDPKGRQHQIVLQAGRLFHTHRGSLRHDDLIGREDGCVVTASSGTAYLALRPLLSDYTLAMGRGAAVIYPKDAAQIVGLADIFPGARVLEAGAGSGALSCWLLRAAGESGLVVSYERRSDFADIARGNVERCFGGPHPAWRLIASALPSAAEPGAAEPGAAEPGAAEPVAAEPGAAEPVAAAADPRGADDPRLADGSGTAFDRVVLDLVDPWEHVPAAARWLAGGGLICCYVATTPQLSRTVEALRGHGGFDEPAAWETIQRGWHVDGLAVRPEHRMIGHTGFLITARRLAAGVTAPPRRRRPSKGAHPPAEAGTG